METLYSVLCAQSVMGSLMFPPEALNGSKPKVIPVGSLGIFDTYSMIGNWCHICVLSVSSIWLIYQKASSTENEQKKTKTTMNKNASHYVQLLLSYFHSS